LSSGLIRQLADKFPEARFTIAVGPAAAPLFADLPGLERIIVVQKRRWRLHWLDLWTKVVARRWGLVVDMRGSTIVWLVSSRRRAAYHHDRGMGSTHKVVEIARALGLDRETPSPFLFTSPATDAAARAYLGEGGPILAIAPGANWVGKRWPAERFAAVAARLLDKNGALADGRLLVVGGPAERDAAQVIAAAVGPDRVIGAGPGELDLLTTYACLKRARLFIGNDSGAMHLASAAGAPALFGPSDELRYGPWGQNAMAVRGPRSRDEILRIDPGLNRSTCHMLDLSVDQVAQAAADLITQSKASA
jgi:ADP-heptose:LPS heptosyltransferase